VAHADLWLRDFDHRTPFLHEKRSRTDFRAAHSISADAALLYDQLDEVRHEPLGVDVHFEKAVASARHLYEYIPVRLRCQMRPCQSDLAANSQRMAETDD
jgi:hypothetical protein